MRELLPSRLILRRYEWMKRLRLVTLRERMVGEPEYISSQEDRSSSIPRILSHPSSPDVVMNPSRRDTVRYRRLFPVFTAAKPSVRVMAI